MIKQGSQLPASASRPPLSQLRLPSASAARRGTGRFAGQFPAGDGKAAGRVGEDTVMTERAAKNGVWRPCWWLFFMSSVLLQTVRRTAGRKTKSLSSLLPSGRRDERQTPPRYHASLSPRKFRGMFRVQCGRCAASSASFPALCLVLSGASLKEGSRLPLFVIALRRGKSYQIKKESQEIFSDRLVSASDTFQFSDQWSECPVPGSRQP